MIVSTMNGWAMPICNKPESQKSIERVRGILRSLNVSYPLNCTTDEFVYFLNQKETIEAIDEAIRIKARRLRNEIITH